MEWVETTAKTLDEAKEERLPALASHLTTPVRGAREPRSGLFGLRRSARIARVRPEAVRPKQDRRQRRRDGGKNERNGRGGGQGSRSANGRGAAQPNTSAGPAAVPPADTRTAGETGAPDRGEADTSAVADAAGVDAAAADVITDSGERRRNRRRGGRGRGQGAAANYGADNRGADVNDDNETYDHADHGGQRGDDEITVAVADVQAAAEGFGRGLLDAFGIAGAVSTSVDDRDIELRIEPAEGAADGVGLLIGPGGRTLSAVQELARVAAQRRLGDHETRLRVDVAGYRERRRGALEKFANHVAELVQESGVARSLDPMPSPDRKVIHDVLAGFPGVTSRSEGEDPNRRIIVSPAATA